MTPRVKTMLKVVAGHVVIIVLLTILLAFVAVRYVPTGEDARISEKIHDEFEAAIITNLPPDKHPRVVSSPRRNSTDIFVKGAAFSDSEKQGLRAVAVGIGHMNADHPIRVFFQTDTNHEAIIRP